MRQEIYDYLAADSTLLALLPGGLYDALAVGLISRQTTPAAFDSFKEIQPCALFALGTDVPANRRAARLTFTLSFYQRHGAAAVDAARQRVYTLLHHRTITSVPYVLMHADDVVQQVDEALDASLQISRYVGYTHKS